MKYVLDVSAVAGMMRGEVMAISKLGFCTIEDVAIPHPVVAHMSERFARFDASTWPGASLHARWDKTRELVRRCVWTEEVSAALAELRRSHPEALELDRMVAAHALGHGASVVTGTVAAQVRFSRFSGLRVEHWGPDEGRGKNAVSP